MSTTRNPPSTGASPLLQPLSQLKEHCGAFYDTYAPRETEVGGASKQLNHRERTRKQRAMEVELRELHHSFFSAPSSSLTAAELETLIRLLPSLVALSALPTSEDPLLRIADAAFQQQKDGTPAPSLPDTTVEPVLQALTRLLYFPEPWSAGAAKAALGIRITAAAILAPVLRFFVAHAQESVVLAHWRQWQELASGAVLERLHEWISVVEAALTASTTDSARKGPSVAKSASYPAALPLQVVNFLQCQLLGLTLAVMEHPCARSLATDSWARLLGLVMLLIGPPRAALGRLELVYAALHVIQRAGEAGVVSPGVWRAVAMQAVAKSVPHSEADAPAPLPVSSLTSSGINYASVFLTYLRLVKALLFLEVEEDATGGCAGTEVTDQLHTALVGLVKTSAHVYVENGTISSSAAPAPTNASQVSLLAVVVKNLLSVQEQSHSSPRQYARYVNSMLVGPQPLVPSIIQCLAHDCLLQCSFHPMSQGSGILNTNVEILQGVFLWSIHAVVDESLLDLSQRARILATLPWEPFDAASIALGHLSRAVATTLSAHHNSYEHSDAPVLAARVIACEGLALLLEFLLFVVIPNGVADEVSWNASFRGRVRTAEARVMRIVAAFDRGAPHASQALTAALERTTTVLGPAAARVSALLPSATRPSLAPAGCKGALDELLEVIPIF